MLCERCEKSEATVHLTEIVKNVKSEVHLCDKCARMSDFNPELTNFSLSLPEMLSFLDVGEFDDSFDTNKCATCGLTYLEYRRIGKLGCSDCYKYLWFALEPVISSYHGEKRHIGKIPLSYTEVKAIEEVLLDTKTKLIGGCENVSELRRKLEIAVDEERYEDAAELRDRIKEIERVD